MDTPLRDRSSRRARLRGRAVGGRVGASAAARLQALGRIHRWNLEPDDITYRITRPLLLDVIHAACGIEYTVERLLAAIDEVQQWLDDSWQDLEPGEISVSAERWDVSFEVSNLVVWARTLLERLETKSRVGGVEVKIGLLPALADSDRKDQVQRFRDELAGWVEAEGYLAGFVLHIGRLHGGHTKLYARARRPGSLPVAGSAGEPGLVVGGVHLPPQSGRKSGRGRPARTSGALHGWAAH